MVRRSPTLTIAVVLVVVFLAEVLLDVVGVGVGMLALSTPIAVQPWTVVTSIYAHGGPTHLISNLIGLVVLGLFLERQTSPARFHAFFLGSGAVAGLAEVWVADIAGQSVTVLGASGAIFALLGYVLSGNRVSDTVLDRLPISPRAQLVVFALVAAGLTVATAGRRVALVAHFTGLLVGLLAGRAHLLRT